MTGKPEPPKPEPPETPAPTLDGLAAEIAYNRRRIARLEDLLGVATEATLLDLPEQEALAAVGGDLYRLEQMREQAKQSRGRQ